MVTEGFEQYFKLGKNALNPWNDVGKTVWDLYRRMNQGTMEIASDNLSRAADQLKRISATKRPEELLSLQKECLSENISSVMSDFQKFVSLSLGSFEEVNKTFTSTLKEQQQSASKVAEKEKAR